MFLHREAVAREALGGRDQLPPRPLAEAAVQLSETRHFARHADDLSALRVGQRTPFERIQIQLRRSRLAEIEHGGALVRRSVIQRETATAEATGTRAHDSRHERRCDHCIGCAAARAQHGKRGVGTKPAFGGDAGTWPLHLRGGCRLRCDCGFRSQRRLRQQQRRTGERGRERERGRSRDAHRPDATSVLRSPRGLEICAFCS
jgi:hypothetical protein